MTTGAFLNTLAHCEAHIAIVNKARALSVADPKFRSPHEIVDEMNALLVSASLPIRLQVRMVKAKDVMESLNQV